MLGTIALDIDGTLTTDGKGQLIHAPVAKCLNDLANKGWRLIFLTGRAMDSAQRILSPLKFNYYLAAQNGAIVFEMPSCKMTYKQYLNRSIIAKMEAICLNFASDFAVYSGYENKDAVYYRPKKFSKDLLSYLEKRAKVYHEIWYPMESFDEMPICDFPTVKCFESSFETANEISRLITDNLKLHAPVIKDPFNPSFYVIQASHSTCTKGLTLLNLFQILGRQGVTIAAGDDMNDLCMLKVADIKIAMSHSPKELLSLADIISKPYVEYPIIDALYEAVRHVF